MGTPKNVRFERIKYKEEEELHYLVQIYKKTELIGESYTTFAEEGLSILDKVNIENKFMKKGYGKLLMIETLKEIDKRNDVAKIIPAPLEESEGMKQNQLVRFYEKFGFRRMDKKSNLMIRERHHEFVKKDNETIIIYRKD